MQNIKIKRLNSPQSTQLKSSLRKKASSAQWDYYYKEIKKLLKDIPEIREDKVKMLKKNIWASNYWIDSKKLAEKIIEESLFDILL